MLIDFETKYPKEYQKGFLIGEKLYEDGKYFSMKHVQGDYKTVGALCAAEIGCRDGYDHAEAQDYKVKEYGEELQLI